MILQGKGFFTYNLSECEGGEPGSILSAAQAAGLSHVLVKIADGERAFGINPAGIDLTAPVVQALRAAGIAVWGWHSIHGNNPSAEATIAIARTQSLGLDGYVLEANDDYGRTGMAGAARQFMTAVRGALAVPIALSSYRFPNFHPELPWSTFLEFCDLHMPQVTWEQAHNVGEQLRESMRQCAALPNARPCIPTGPAYVTSGWSPASGEVNEFMNTAKALGLPAVNFFNWDTCRGKLPLLWKAIAGFVWPSAPSVDDFLTRFLAALNSRQAAQASAFYGPAATQVWADQIQAGSAAIQTGYAAFFNSLPAGAILTVSQAQVEDDLCLFSWKAGPLSGETTLMLKDRKIVLDYTFIT